MILLIKKKIALFLIWLLWLFADDALEHTRTLEEIYGVGYQTPPDDIKDEDVLECEFHIYKTNNIEKIKKMNKWLNKED